MTKTAYRVLAGANLDAFPRGTKVGGEVLLTEAEALYERDMGRVEAVNAAAPVPGETKGYPADATTGEAIALTDEERARIEAGADIGSGEGAMTLVHGQAGDSQLAAAPEHGTKASVPFMITVAMRKRLRALGKTEDEITQMKPEEAHALLAADDPPVA